MVSTPLKNISQNGNLPQIGVKIKNIWNHHPVPLGVLKKFGIHDSTGCKKNDPIKVPQSNLPVTGFFRALGALLIFRLKKKLGRISSLLQDGGFFLFNSTHYLLQFWKKRIPRHQFQTKGFQAIYQQEITKTEKVKTFIWGKVLDNIPPISGR